VYYFKPKASNSITAQLINSSSDGQSIQLPHNYVMCLYFVVQSIELFIKSILPSAHLFLFTVFPRSPIVFEHAVCHVKE